MTTWQIILDVAIVLIFVLTIASNIKRGFIKSFFQCTKLIIVLLITTLVAPSLVDTCEDYFVRDMIEGKVSVAIEVNLEGFGDDFDFSIECYCIYFSSWLFACSMYFIIFKLYDCYICNIKCQRRKIWTAI